MRFTVDIEDFWLDEGEDIEPALKEHIIVSVVSKIDEKLSIKIKESITEVAKLEIEKKFSEKTSKVVDEFIKNGKITHYSQERTVEEHIKYLFNDTNGWGTPHEMLKKLAKEFGDELKNRYDLFFATQIVKKLADSGLLAEGIAKSLINDK